MDSLRQYSRAWYDTMTRIWTDRLDLLGVRHTGALRRSVAGAGFSVTDGGGSMAFRFLQYGLYVDAGTGRGYRRGNGGDLEFLGKAYRVRHRLGRARRKRPWFSPSWAISCRVLADAAARLAADEFTGLFAEL